MCGVNNKVSLSTDPKECKSAFCREMCTAMFITTLFLAVKMAAVWWSESEWAPTPVCLNTWPPVSGVCLEEVCQWGKGLRFQRFPGHSQYALCLLLADQGVSSQLFLPPCLCSSTSVNSDPLKP